MRLNLDFETGDFSEFDSVVQRDMTVTEAAALGGTSYGLSSLVNDTQTQYADKLFSAPASGFLRFRIYTDFTLLALADMASLAFVQIRTTGIASGYAVYVAYTRNAAQGHRYSCYIRNDDNSTTIGYSSWQPSIPTSIIEVRIQQASADGEEDGEVSCFVDDEELVVSSAYANFNSFAGLTSIRVGMTYSSNAATAGTYYLDQIVVVDNDLRIGPMPTPTPVIIPSRSFALITPARSFTTTIQSR